MKREQLAHILRSACRILGDDDALVIGSQAILGSFDEDALPAEATMSVEADLAFRDDPGARKADEVDGAIGELSQFHETFGYYAQGVDASTAVLPAGWEDRVVPFDPTNPEGPACLEPHDLVVSKLVAGREKDLEFARALLASGHVEAGLLHERAGAIARPPAVRDRVQALIRRLAP